MLQTLITSVLEEFIIYFPLWLKNYMQFYGCWFFRDVRPPFEHAAPDTDVNDVCILCTVAGRSFIITFIVSASLLMKFISKHTAVFAAIVLLFFRSVRWGTATSASSLKLERETCMFGEYPACWHLLWREGLGINFSNVASILRGDV